ncbi:helix-turn-helix domain-containing protein [Mycobacterium sp. IS-1742]|uniref:helix-turn-helix domain-containing protein n=1 Tax=Mycobacterium sp. IS-1742 TaxID=1772285 RepID=UPI0018D20575|nr:helix-turn-helix domain-containing protein [Mycobacterium sp. IS-1742]
MLLSVDEARTVLDVLEAQDFPPANVRIAALNLRRAIGKTGIAANRDASGSTRRIPAQRVADASASTGIPARQRNSAQHGSHATLSADEAAAVLGITPNGVRDLRRRGRLPAERVNGRWRFIAANVEARARNGA